MSSKRPGNLELGSKVVELLVKQRRPMLMVDFVHAFVTDPVPTIEAGRHISMNEPFFEGHFPDMPLWPGALSMEGLGQSATILTVLTVLTRAASAAGEDPEGVLESLRNLDRGYRMHPGYQSVDLHPRLAGLRNGEASVTVGASVDLKFLQPVFPGCRLDYHVQWTGDYGDFIRFSVEAAVGDTIVVKGNLTGAWTRTPLPKR
ncbi:MAG: 3-hydroxyacyl-ACP dehydratase FabZ family protein [Gemmatimonadales bacterium]